MNLEYIEEKVFIPIKSRREVWTDTLTDLMENEKDNEVLIKHFQWCLNDLDILEEYYKEEFKFMRKIEEGK